MYNTIKCSLLNFIREKSYGSYTSRRGPSFVGIFGLLQPLADGLKLFIKEIIPDKSNKFLFLLAPVLFLARIIKWAIMHLMLAV